MKVEVLYIAECPNHESAVQRARAALRTAGMPAIIHEIEVRTKADAEAWKFPGSPTVRINGLDVEPEARGAQHFGVGCRSYVENGRRSGEPSQELIQRALRENAGSQKKEGADIGVLVAGGLAAVLASTCCLGPLILVTLGFSGAWIGNLTLLEPFRPWLIAGALFALVFAGRRIFRRAESCAPGEVCAIPAVRRAYQVLFGLVGALILVAWAYPYLAQVFLLVSNRHIQELSMKMIFSGTLAAFLLITPIWAAPRTARLKVPGMTCAACPITIKKALSKVNGVEKVEVSFQKKEAVVTFDDAKTDEKALMKATTDAGYPSETVKSDK